MDDCHVALDYWVSMNGSPNFDVIGALNPVFSFKLEHTNQQPNWLPGTSTNWSLPNAPSDEPDYLFEASQNPPTAGLPAPTITPDGLEMDNVMAPTVTVTSHDYGGSANLRAFVTFTNVGSLAGVPGTVTVQPTILLSTDWDYLTPPACAGTGIFASLPVDQDCNGIADSWEAPYIATANTKSLACSGPPIPFFTGSEDLEQGYTCSSPKGDGWSVHDEYRGFHFVADDGVTAKWASTDPVKTFDVFFWDAGFSPTGKLAEKYAADPSVFTKALRTILCLQGSAAEMDTTFPTPPTVGIPTTPPPVPLNPNLVGYHYCYGSATTTLQPGASPTLSPSPVGVNEYDPTIGVRSQPNPLKFWYRRVSAAQANAVSSTQPALGVKWFNQNSLTSASTQGNHTVVIYDYEPQRDGVLAATQNNLSSCLYCGDPQHFKVSIDYPNIVQFAQKYAARGKTTISPDILTAEVVAHETGHWFQQNHSQRHNCCAYTAGKASALDWAHFAFDSVYLPRILIGLEQYKNGSRQKTPLDKMPCAATTPTATTTTVKGVTPPMQVYNVGFASGFTPEATSASTLIVWNLQYELMDWTPNFTLADPTQWHFDPANLNALCAQNPCPPASSGTDVCTTTYPGDHQ